MIAYSRLWKRGIWTFNVGRFRRSNTMIIRVIVGASAIIHNEIAVGLNKITKKQRSARCLRRTLSELLPIALRLAPKHHLLQAPSTHPAQGEHRCQLPTNL